MNPLDLATDWAANVASHIWERATTGAAPIIGLLLISAVTLHAALARR